MQLPDHHSIERSRLYRIGRRKDLASLLGVSLAELKELSSDRNFKEWPKKRKGKKDRIIEEPLPRLAALLSTLHRIMRCIETPAWLMSGKRGIKPKDNAEAHCGSRYVITVDINSFFQSTKREFVYKALKKYFDQTDDVASLLASVVTYKGHIPTGTATSQVLAFWAYRPTFERIQSLCASKGITMTLWVDDITFSSNSPFPKSWLKEISLITNAVDLSIKAEKTKIYNSREYKVVTGSAISPDGKILVKNEKRKELLDLLENKKVEGLSLMDARRLFGKLVSQRQNEPDFFSGVYSRCKSHIKKLQQRELDRKKSSLG